jgi:hypothetical protein
MPALLLFSTLLQGAKRFYLFRHPERSSPTFFLHALVGHNGLRSDFAFSVIPTEGLRSWQPEVEGPWQGLTVSGDLRTSNEPTVERVFKHAAPTAIGENEVAKVEG